MIEQQIKDQFPTYQLELGVQLGKYTNTKVGGKADIAFWPRDLDELKAVLAVAHEAQLPITVLGNASNLIISDEGLRGLVIFLTKMREINVIGTQITAAAGALIIDVAQVAQQNSLAGLAWAAGIPGSIGGAVYMNAGAYGGQIDTVITKVSVLTTDGALKEMTKEELAFGYRHSAVQETGDIILSATFTLQPGDATEILSEMEDFNTRRALRQPLEFPSCGSVFKRPEGHFAGKLIMDAGLQGYQSGGAQVSTKHAGFIVNKGNATAADYVAVIKHVQAEVQRQFNVQLEPEVRVLGQK